MSGWAAYRLFLIHSTDRVSPHIFSRLKRQPQSLANSSSVLRLGLGPIRESNLTMSILFRWSVFFKKKKKRENTQKSGSGCCCLLPLLSASPHFDSSPQVRWLLVDAYPGDPSVQQQPGQPASHAINLRPFLKAFLICYTRGEGRKEKRCFLFPHFFRRVENEYNLVDSLFIITTIREKR